jgi:hypothetical protein
MQGVRCIGPEGARCPVLQSVTDLTRARVIATHFLPWKLLPISLIVLTDTDHEFSLEFADRDASSIVRFELRVTHHQLQRLASS